MELAVSLVSFLLIVFLYFLLENFIWDNIIPIPRKFNVYYQINNTEDMSDIAIGVSTNSKKDKKRFYTAEIYYKDGSREYHHFESYDKFHGEFTVYDNLYQIYLIQIFKRGKVEKDNIGFIQINIAQHVKQEKVVLEEIGSFHKLEDF